MTRDVAKEIAELLESANDVGDHTMAATCRRALGGDETAQAVAIAFYDEVAAQTTDKEETMNVESMTDEELVRALLAHATAEGDQELEDVCRRALDGDHDAIDEALDCAAVLNDGPDGP